MHLLLLIVITFFISISSLLIFRKIALHIDLTDAPSVRKQHNGHIPLIGGISVYISILVYLIIDANKTPSYELYIFCTSILVFTGIIDDKFDLSFKIRFLIQSLVACAMIFAGKIYLISLGGIIPNYSLNLDYFGYGLTVIAVLAAINAFNMTDGIDGLLGILSIITLLPICIITYLTYQFELSKFCLILIVAIIPFLFFNLGILPYFNKYKIFMGDAGSMFIGFTIIWILLQSTQIEPSPIQPVTALWLIGLPLMDLVTVMLRRAHQGKSMFKPDREHLHHIFMRAGLSQQQTLVTISIIAMLFSIIGLVTEYTNIPEWISFISFLGFFTLYALFTDFYSKKVLKA